VAAIHLFGGTSDARALCAVLDQLQLDYSVSVATDTGRELAGDIGGSVHVGRLDEPAMIDWLATRGVKWVIDAAHPYASALHANIRAACQALDLRLLRFERPSEIESIVHPLLTVVDDIAAACEVARSLGERVLLTTGSKDLARYQHALPEKLLLARVLPTSTVLAECEALGFGVEQIIAMKGPFDAELNRALYRACRCDLVITKESGAEGGYQEKVRPCLELGIPCIVIRRPHIEHDSRWGEIISTPDALKTCLAAGHEGSEQ
jgi:precorrin-6A/cobalt-precorrin-6A reductase